MWLKGFVAIPIYILQQVLNTRKSMVLLVICDTLLNREWSFFGIMLFAA